MPASRQPLSVAIITLNAAAQLEECLKSAHFADDIVVVDSGSTDGTQMVADMGRDAPGSSPLPVAALP